MGFLEAQAYLCEIHSASSAGDLIFEEKRTYSTILFRVACGFDRLLATYESKCKIRHLNIFIEGHSGKQNKRGFF